MNVGNAIPTRKASFTYGIVKLSIVLISWLRVFPLTFTVGSLNVLLRLNLHPVIRGYSLLLFTLISTYALIDAVKVAMSLDVVLFGCRYISMTMDVDMLASETNIDNNGYDEITRIIVPFTLGEYCVSRDGKNIWRNVTFI